MVRRTPMVCALMSLAAGAAACGEPVAAPPDATFRIEPTAQWSGNWVRVHSRALAAAGSVSITEVGDTTPLETTRVADTSIAVRLPDAMSGTLSLRLRLDRWSYFLEPIEVYGYTGVRSLPVYMDGDLLVWPRNGHASVLAGTPDGVAIVQANTGQVRLFPGTGRYGFPGVRGPGATEMDGVFVLAPIENAFFVEVWRLLPTTQRLLVDSGVMVGRQVMRLNPTAWVVGGPHALWLQRWSDTLGRYQDTMLQAEEVEGVNMSPRGDRATVRVDWVAGGVPVFDAPAGTIAYRVAGLQRVAGADFSADGEWLALVGGSDWGGIGDTNRLMLIRAATGEIVRDTILDRVAFAVTLDAYAPLMYVGVVGLNGQPTLLVFERDSGRLLAELHVPASAPRCYCYKAVIARSAEPALYLVWGFERGLVWRFTMLPGVPEGDAGPEVARGNGRP